MKSEEVKKISLKQSKFILYRLDKFAVLQDQQLNSKYQLLTVKHSGGNTIV